MRVLVPVTPGLRLRSLITRLRCSISQALTITSATPADSIAGVDAYVILREPGLRDPLPNSLPPVSLLDPGPGNTASITLPRPGDSHLVWEIAMLAHELDWWTNAPDYARPVITHHPYDVTITGIPSD
jgi:hypothetical protein